MTPKDKEVEIIARLIATNEADWESFKGKALKVVDYYKRKDGR
jgi:hypothetical protein